MKEIIGDIWDYQDGESYIVIPTNGTVKKNGEAVMGRGLALQAKQKYPILPFLLGQALSTGGNKPYFALNVAPGKIKIITFPVKEHWLGQASLRLIKLSTRELVYAFGGGMLDKATIYLPRVGCGNGKLNWADVKPILEKSLDDRFTVVSLPKSESK